MMRHPTPPPVALPPGLAELADRLAVQLADGALDFQDCCRLVHCATGTPPPDYDGARAIWRARDGAADIARRRRRAEWNARLAIRPLFAARAPAETIEAAALRAAGGVLSRPALFALLVAERDRARRAASWGGRHGR